MMSAVDVLIAKGILSRARESGAGVEGDDGKGQINVRNVGANDQQTTLILYYQDLRRRSKVPYNYATLAVKVAPSVPPSGSEI